MLRRAADEVEKRFKKMLSGMATNVFFDTTDPRDKSSGSTLKRINGAGANATWLRCVKHHTYGPRLRLVYRTSASRISHPGGGAIFNPCINKGFHTWGRKNSR
ncbi:hypothetical protein PoB_004358500 [Plakobranchus ocellatus]|uniref:Uncharacterized protein n=1 Tax=Plakobranchus ocellatus TaxID=259542 RepID=A0AAV4B923_9GAST|nr:hypothetical protein PoB_004358500 [Plakobranchus ocellatus]